MNQDIINKISILINCNPSYCKTFNCPLYDDNGYCHYDDVLMVFSCVTQEKFENINKNKSKYGESK